MQTRPAFAKIMVREVLSGGKHMDQKIFPHFIRVYELLQDVVNEGVGLGRFRAVSPVLTHIGLVGNVLFFYASASFRERVLRSLGIPADQVTEEKYMRYWTDLILRGLGPDATSEDTRGATLHRDQPDAAWGRGDRPESAAPIVGEPPEQGERNERP